MGTLLPAAIVMGVTGLIHSVVGEMLWLRHASRFETPRLPWGTERLAIRTMRATWHVASFLALGFAAIALELSRREPLGEGDRLITTTMAIALVASSLAVFVVTRAKHPGWIAIGIAAALCFKA